MLQAVDQQAAGFHQANVTTAGVAHIECRHVDLNRVEERTNATHRLNHQLGVLGQDVDAAFGGVHDLTRCDAEVGAAGAAQFAQRDLAGRGERQATAAGVDLGLAGHGQGTARGQGDVAAGGHQVAAGAHDQAAGGHHADVAVGAAQAFVEVDPTGCGGQRHGVAAGGGHSAVDRERTARLDHDGRAAAADQALDRQRVLLVDVDRTQGGDGQAVHLHRGVARTQGHATVGGREHHAAASAQRTDGDTAGFGHQGDVAGHAGDGTDGDRAVGLDGDVAAAQDLQRRQVQRAGLVDGEVASLGHDDRHAADVGGQAQIAADADIQRVGRDLATQREATTRLQHHVAGVVAAASNVDVRHHHQIAVGGNELDQLALAGVGRQRHHGQAVLGRQAEAAGVAVGDDQHVVARLRHRVGRTARRRVQAAGAGVEGGVGAARGQGQGLGGAVDAHRHQACELELVFQRCQQAGPVGCHGHTVDGVAHFRGVLHAVEGDGVFGGAGRGRCATGHHHRGHLRGARTGCRGGGRGVGHGGGVVDQAEHSHARDGEGLVDHQPGQGDGAIRHIHRGRHLGVGVDGGFERAQDRCPVVGDTVLTGFHHVVFHHGVVGDAQRVALVGCRGLVGKLHLADLHSHARRDGRCDTVVHDLRHILAQQAAHGERLVDAIGGEHQGVAARVHVGQQAVGGVGVDRIGQRLEHLVGIAHDVLVHHQTAQLNVADAVLGHREGAVGGVQRDRPGQGRVGLDRGFQTRQDRAPAGAASGHRVAEQGRCVGTASGPGQADVDLHAGDRGEVVKHQHTTAVELRRQHAGIGHEAPTVGHTGQGDGVVGHHRADELAGLAIDLRGEGVEQCTQ